MFCEEKPIVLADIGNTRFHLFDGVRVWHLTHKEALREYRKERVYYINVCQSLEKELFSIKNWHNIAPKIVLCGAYETMGVDRKALCLSRGDGLYVDAGSAITVDVVKSGCYCGGFILPGILAWLSCYASISTALQSELNPKVSFDTLPRTTKDAISYGIIGSIKALIDKHRCDLPLYITGGDGELLSGFFEDAFYDSRLVFDGMYKVIKDQEC